MRILSTRWPYPLQRSAEVSEVITASFFPLALTAQQLSVITLQACKWELSVTGSWSVSVRRQILGFGPDDGVWDINESGVISADIELDNRSEFPEKVLLPEQWFSVTGSDAEAAQLDSRQTPVGVEAPPGEPLPGEDASAIYDVDGWFSVMQLKAAPQYELSGDYRWLRHDGLYVPSIECGFSMYRTGGDIPFLGSSIQFSLNASTGQSEYVSFIDGLRLYGKLALPTETGPPDVDSPPGVYLWDLSANYSINATLRPVEFRPYDPGDGGGPFYNTTTGQLLRVI